MSELRAIIEIKNGIAEIAYCPKSVEVEIIYLDKHQNLVALPPRKVCKVDKSGYAIWELEPEAKNWVMVGKYYRYSTTAYEALGRITEKESNQA